MGGLVGMERNLNLDTGDGRLARRNIAARAVELMKPFFHVVTPAQARQMLGTIRQVDAEKIGTTHARGRVLAEDLYSEVDLPHFHRAAMDGYAVSARDTFGASAS